MSSTFQKILFIFVLVVMTLSATTLLAARRGGEVDRGRFEGRTGGRHWDGNRWDNHNWNRNWNWRGGYNYNVNPYYYSGGYYYYPYYDYYYPYYNYPYQSQ